MTPDLAALDQWGFAAARYLLAALWQSTLVFATVAALNLALRRYTPGVRRALWLVALLVAPALPLLSNLAKPSGLPQQEVGAFPAYAPPTFPEVEVDVEAAPTSSSVPRPAPPTMSTRTAFDYPWAIALTMYGLGATAFLVWTLLGHARIRLWMRAGAPVSDPRITEAFAAAAERLRLRRRVRVVMSAHLPAPLTAGILRPAVLLPIGLSHELSAEDLYAIALHESVHVKQYEPLVLTLASLVRCGLFFHPLVWLACRRLATLAEHSADEAVLEVTGAPTAYAKLLTTFAERLPRRTPAAEGAAGLVFCKSAFLKRVEAILGDRNRIRKLTRVALACTVAAALVTLATALALPLGSKEPVHKKDSTLPAKPATVQPAGVGAMSGPSEFVKVLPDGIQVELVGISTQPTKDHAWWNPKGERLEKTPEAMGGGSLSVPSGKKALEFAFRVKAPVGSPFAHRISFESGAQRYDSVSGGGGTGRDGVWRERAVGAFPVDLRTCDVRYGAATGKWKTLCELDRPAGGAAHWDFSSASSQDGDVQISDPLEIGGKSRVVAAYTNTSLRGNVRIAALGKNGQEIPSSNGGGSASGGKLGMLTANFDIPLGKVKAFLFQTRPFEWAVFKNVPLTPPSAAPQSRSDAAPRLKLRVTDGGRPVAGAQVLLVKPGDDCFCREGRFIGSSSHNPPGATTKADGGCDLASVAGPFVVVATHSSGYATCSRKGLAAAHGTIRLKPWAVFEGRARITDKRYSNGPFEAQETLFFDKNGDVAREPLDGGIRISFICRFKTDSADRFKVERVPGKLVTFSPPSPPERDPKVVYLQVAAADGWFCLDYASKGSYQLFPLFSPKPSTGNDFRFREVPVKYPISIRLENTPSTQAASPRPTDRNAGAEMPASAPRDDVKRIHANTVEGLVTLDRKLVLPLEMWEKKPVSGYPRLTFTRDHGKLGAAIQFKYPSYPHTRWLARLEVLDQDGKSVFTGSKTFQNSGTIATVPHGEEGNLRFTVPADQADRARRFRLSMDTLCVESGNPFRFGEDVPLKLHLDAPEFSGMIWLDGLRVTRSDTGATATFHALYLPSPKTTWRVSVRLTDAEGKEVGTGYKDIENSGGPIMYISRPQRQVSDLAVPITWRLDARAGVARYTVTLEKLELRITTRSDALIRSAPGENLAGHVRIGLGYFGFNDVEILTDGAVNDLGRVLCFGNVTVKSAVRGSRSFTIHCDNCSIAKNILAPTVECKGNVTYELPTLELAPSKGRTDTLTVNLRTGKVEAPGTAPGRRGNPKTGTKKATPETATAHTAPRPTSVTPVEQALDKRVSLNMSNTHLANVVETLSRATGAKIEIDSAVVMPPKGAEAKSPSTHYISNGVVPYVKLSNVTLREALRALTKPMGLKFIATPGSIWITARDKAVDVNPLEGSGLHWPNPGPAERDRHASHSDHADRPLTNEDSGPSFAMEVKVLEVRHPFGERALHDLKPCPGARRLEGDAQVFLGPVVHVGNVVFSLSPLDACVPRYDDSSVASSGRKPPVKLELITAPRVTTGAFHAGDSYKTLLNDQTRGKAFGRGAHLAKSARDPSTFANFFLLKEFTPNFLEPALVASANQVQLKPVVIGDYWTKTLIRRERSGRETTVLASGDPLYGVAIGESTTVQKDTGELRTDFIFRMREDTAFGYHGVAKPGARSHTEETAFRYVIQCKPDDMVGFALPYRHRGHLFVVVTFERIDGSTAVEPPHHGQRTSL